MLAQVGNGGLAAVGAAAAAICSLGAALAAWRSLRQSALQSVRPLLRLEDWSLECRDGSTVVRARKVSNLGNGPAFNISVFADGAWIPKFASTPFGPLPAGTTRSVCFLRILDGVGQDSSDDYCCSLRVRLAYRDASGHHYETLHPLQVRGRDESPDGTAPGAERLAPGLWLIGGSARRTPWWSVRWAATAERLARRVTCEWPQFLARLSGRP